MASAPPPIIVATARPQERTAALEVFFQHVAATERSARVERVLAMIAQGDLAADGLFVCRADGVLAGAMVAAVLPGATGLVWPPSALPGDQQALVEDLLVRRINEWLRQRGCKFAQALLTHQEAPLGALLQRNGYKHITTLLYARNDLAALEEPTAAWDPPALTCEPYTHCDRAAFHTALLASYEDTLDCPELNEARTVEEIVAGYAGMPGCRPEHWWLARQAGQPAGVLILAEHAGANLWEMCYLGVVPRARRSGLGRALTRKAMHQARATGATGLILTMDARNMPAYHLYRELGFEPYDGREVYLSLFDNER